MCVYHINNILKPIKNVIYVSSYQKLELSKFEYTLKEAVVIKIY